MPKPGVDYSDDGNQDEAPLSAGER
jgi:hypothetical protein